MHFLVIELWSCTCTIWRAASVKGKTGSDGHSNAPTGTARVCRCCLHFELLQTDLWLRFGGGFGGCSCCSAPSAPGPLWQHVIRALPLLVRKAPPLHRLEPQESIGAVCTLDGFNWTCGCDLAEVLAAAVAAPTSAWHTLWRTPPRLALTGSEGPATAPTGTARVHRCCLHFGWLQSDQRLRFGGDFGGCRLLPLLHGTHFGARPRALPLLVRKAPPLHRPDAQESIGAVCTLDGFNRTHGCDLAEVLAAAASLHCLHRPHFDRSRCRLMRTRSRGPATAPTGRARVHRCCLHFGWLQSDPRLRFGGGFGGCCYCAPFWELHWVDCDGSLILLPMPLLTPTCSFLLQTHQLLFRGP